jgi:hypothetical protein
MWKWLLIVVALLAMLAPEVAEAGPLCKGLRFIGRGAARAATLPVRAVRRGAGRARAAYSGCATAPATAPSLVKTDEPNPLVAAWKSDLPFHEVLIASK